MSNVVELFPVKELRAANRQPAYDAFLSVARARRFAEMIKLCQEGAIKRFFRRVLRK